MRRRERDKVKSEEGEGEKNNEAYRHCSRTLSARILDNAASWGHPFNHVTPFRLLPAGSISNIDDGEYLCPNGAIPTVRNQVNQVISGVVGAASSVTSIQVANLLRLFKIPQVGSEHCFSEPHVCSLLLSIVYWRCRQVQNNATTFKYNGHIH